MTDHGSRTGGISVETEHIFPIIKKWLYSEREIFLRELVSNACDAVTKLRRLASLGEYDPAEETYRIDVSFSKSKKTLTVSDNGIGMTEDELDRYICKMALSGAMDFIQKYEGKTDGASGIIGHFGLGFYSAFMVADTVEIVTRSYTDAPAVHWSCTEAGEYVIDDAERPEHGTSVILHLNEESEEYLGEYKLREILQKYCAFMPTEIYLTDEDAPEKEDAKDAAQKDEPKPVNDTHPLWQKNPSDCTEEEYKDFYQRVFSDYRDTLFHLHLNADYPLNFRGVLYFPRLREGYESLEGKIKLYYNQVFVADNIKEVIPEYLLMLRGVLDCPDLPLNVSRSYLQNSAYVTKVGQYITKKVGDKIVALCQNERETYEKMYPDLKLFLAYASVCERKFYDRVADALLMRTAAGAYMTLPEYLEAAKETNENTVYYATDAKQQAAYLRLFEDKGVTCVIFDNPLDVRLAETIEQYKSDQKLKFRCVDSDLDALKGDGETKAKKAAGLFASFSTDKCKLTVRTEPLADTETPAILLTDEEARRMQDMMRMYGRGDFDFPQEMTLVLNTNNPLIKKLEDGGFADRQETVARQIWLLALLSSRKLEAQEMKDLLSTSYDLMGAL
ncbi:MAG: molecular chaperone HtpG [Clostridia bacterium]|nr:molecular chaperone HtpG [Clostridia bacterium]